MSSFAEKEMTTIQTIGAVLDLVLGHDRNRVFSYSTVGLSYAEDDIGKVRPKIELALSVIRLLCGSDYTVKRFVECKGDSPEAVGVAVHKSHVRTEVLRELKSIMSEAMISETVQPIYEGDHTFETIDLRLLRSEIDKRLGE